MKPLKGIGTNKFILSLCLLLVAYFVQGQVTSNFSANADGWTIFNVSTGLSSAATYNAVGGYITDGGTASGPVILYEEAPAKFKGNFSSSYNQNLTFDLKTDFVGTNNTNGDVIIAGTGGTLYYQLPAKPGVTFTSYVVKLNETFAGWHFGGIGGATPTQTQMKAVLSNITSIRIRTKYTTANTSTATGSLDNVVLNIPTQVPPPIITSFTPMAALPGATVTITGLNFNATASQNIVYFSGKKTIAASATSTQLTVTVPTSAAYGAITVENLVTGLLGSSTQSFNPLFDNNKDFSGRIIPASMSRGYSTLLQSGAENYNFLGNTDKGDLDGDGWIDLIVTEISLGTPAIYYYRNLGTGGTVSTSSFAPAIALSIASIPGGSPNLGELTVADVDSDGKLDIATISSSGGITGYLAVFRNTSTVGSISFASPLFFSYPYYSAQLYGTSGDFDGDGRIDFAYTTGTSPGGIWINQNLSTPGNVDFAYGISVGTNLSHTDITVGDLNGDGKIEIIAPSGTNTEIYQNTSVAGRISFNAPFTIPAVIGGTKIAVADLDADSKLDLAWSAYGSQYVYFSKNNFSGSTFDATSFGSTIQIANTLSNPQGIAVSDINADGNPDLVLTGSSDMGIMQNLGTGALSASSFLSPTLFQCSASGQAISLAAPTIADLDGDNKPEVISTYTNNAVTSSEKGAYIFHNESFPAPAITSIAPGSGNIGATIAINGNLMNTGSTNPTVRLNNTLAAISGVPTNTVTSAISPSGAISGKLSFTNHGLTAYSKNFSLLFNTNRTINSSSFGPSIDFALAINPRDALGVADFDDDGKADVAVIDNGFTTKIFKNTQAPVGQPIVASSLTLQGTTYSAAYNLIALDIDGDGKTDLNTSGGLLQNTSSGSISFSTVTSSTSGFLNSSSSDFNKDGKTDLALINGSLNVQVYENLSRNGSFTPSGTFQNFGGGTINLPLPGVPYGIAASDFDGDGFDDIVSVHAVTNNSTYYLNAKSNGSIITSSFTSLGNFSTTGLQPYDVTANDFDGDGKTDIAITYFNSAFVSVQLNTSTVGNITFSNTDVPVANKGYKLTSQDLDGDGKAEIIVIHQPNPGPGSFTVLQNKSTVGVASFTATNFALTRNPQAVNIADINGDQKPDILIVANSGTVGNALMVFENKILANTITISTQPIDATVCNGVTAPFITAATGTTNIVYQWQFSSTFAGTYNDIANGGGYSNVATSTLSVNTIGNFGAGFYRCKVNGDFATTVFTTAAKLTVNALPTAPTTTGASSCGSGTVLLNASGGSNGQYKWYTVATGGTAIVGEVNSTYTTPLLTITTTYYVTVTTSGCESTRTPVTATILTTPAPTVVGSSACPNSSFSVTASGGTNGQYKWYTVATGGTAIVGEVNSSYTTPLLSATTTYYATITVSGCESARTPVTATILSTGCAPVIASTSLATQVEGKVTLDLKSLITTAGTLDVNSIKVKTPPSSGAIATIVNGVLTIDYKGKPFSGTESITIEACNTNGICSQQAFSIEVAGDIVVYNAVSPNGDDKNEFLYIKYIDVIASTSTNKVLIYNRWGDEVFSISDYDNKTRKFAGLTNEGSKLPSGTYFYKIVLPSAGKTLTGFLSLKY